MTQQHLDGSQVGASFEQMGGKAVAQGMGMDLFVLKSGALRGVLAGCPKNLRGDGTSRRVPAVSGKQPVGGLAPQSAPVDAECIEQLRAEHDITILAALASSNVYDHALAIDITDLQVRHFRATCAGGIERHQQDAMKGRLGGIDQPRHFFLAQYFWQAQNPFRVWRFGDAPAFLQHLGVEEAQSRQSLGYGVRFQFPASEQCGLILANMLWAKLIGSTAEVPAKMLHRTNVGTNGGLGVVATAQLLEHDLA
jgi:hypothetical protein